MSMEAVGAVLAAMVVIFIVGNLWFALVEGALRGLKRLLPHKKQAWHTLPEDEDNTKEDAE